MIFSLLQFTLYLFTFALVLAPLSNARIVCPPDAPSQAACDKCQTALDKIFPKDYFEIKNITQVPNYIHPCDFGLEWSAELLRQGTPDMDVFDPRVPDLLKKTLDTTCAKPSTCSESMAMDLAKTVENECGELVAASKDSGVMNATYAEILLRSTITERTIYCTKDSNGDSHGLKIYTDIVNDAKPKANPDQKFVYVLPQPVVEYYLLTLKGDVTPVTLPASIACTENYAFAVSTVSDFVKKNPPDSRFPYISSSLATANETITKNCPPKKVRRSGIYHLLRRKTKRDI